MNKSKKKPTFKEIQAFDKQAKDRQICHMYYGLRMSQPDIATVYKTTQKSISTILKKAKDDWAESQTEEAINVHYNSDLTIIDALIEEATKDYVKNHDPRTLKEITNLMARKHKLLNLDAPDKVAMTDPDGKEESAMQLVNVVFEVAKKKEDL